MGLEEGYREGADGGTHLTVAQLGRIFPIFGPQKSASPSVAAAVCVHAITISQSRDLSHLR